MQRTPAARARGITKHYQDVVALDGVDLDVDRGQVHGLVGPNGAGKTTLLGLLLGVVGHRRRDAGHPGPADGAVAGRGRRGGRLRRRSRALPVLTARQNLAALAALRGRRSRAAVDDALDRVGLGEVADSRARGFSLGMRQRLGLAAALLSEPRLLVLDEPANGLDPAGSRRVREVLAGLAADGVAVVLSSHRMDDLAALCSEVTILATGRVVFTGPVEKLAAECGELDYRLRTSDPSRARDVARATPGVRVRPLDDRIASDILVVAGPTQALDAVVVGLVQAGVAVRELSPVVSPLEAAFLAVTADAAEDDA